MRIFWSIFGLIPYLFQLYFSKPWYFALRNALGYSTLDRNHLFSFYNMKGVFLFVFPFLINELGVWFAIWGIFNSKKIFQQYFKVSLIFWFATLSIRIAGQALGVDVIERFTYGFFYLGTSPLWLLTWIFFFYIQKNKSKKQLSGLEK